MTVRQFLRLTFRNDRTPPIWQYDPPNGRMWRIWGGAIGLVVALSVFEPRYRFTLGHLVIAFGLGFAGMYLGRILAMLLWLSLHNLESR